MFLTAVNSLANLSREELVAFGAIISAMYTSMIFIAIFIYILYIIINWKTFKKMGEPGWKSIIPIYNDLTLWSKVWSIKAYIIFLIQMVLLSFLGKYLQKLSLASNGQPNTTIYIISIIILVLCVTVIVTAVKYERRFARAFGKGDLFVLGLIFLSIIFDMIIAFGSCEYLGNKSDTFSKKNN